MVTGVAAGTATITYTVSNGSGCTSKQSTVVTVNAKAVQPGVITTASATVKAGSSNVAFSVTNVSGMTYAWSYSGKGQP